MRRQLLVLIWKCLLTASFDNYCFNFYSVSDWRKPKIPTSQYKPLDFSSPIAQDTVGNRPEEVTLEKPQIAVSFTNNKTATPPSFSLTKESYIQIAAIPCEPLGQGRSRSAVPWMVPSAPRPYSPSDISTNSLSSSDRSRLKNSIIDRTGNWRKMKNQLSSKRTPRKLWSGITKRFHKKSINM